MSLSSIVNNSYRVLGVFSNASKKDIERNKSRFAALLRVNKPIPPFPSDFDNLLPAVDRSLEKISKAESELSIAKGKLVQSFFWFVNLDDDDQIGLQLLTEGKTEEATNRWKKAGTINSLQNILVFYLIEEQYRQAIMLAYNIFSVHIGEWCNMFSILSDITAEDIIHTFLDCIYDEIPQQIVSMDWKGLPEEWESYIKKKAVLPLADAISSLVEDCKANKEHQEERYKYAQSLCEQARPLLSQMEELLPADDIILQSCEDKVGSEILNCSIASYNAAFDKLTHGDSSLFREVALACKELINHINTEYLSANVRNRVEENKKIINEKCTNIDKTIEESIAFSDNICWFCGSGEGTLEMKKPYSYSVSKPTWNGTETTTYTKTVTIHLCKECQHEFDERKSWKNITSVVIFALIIIVVLLFTDVWMEWEIGGLIFGAILAGGVSFGLGHALGGVFRKLFDKKNIRHFERDIDDHPLVKLVKSEGYN